MGLRIKDFRGFRVLGRVNGVLGSGFQGVGIAVKDFRPLRVQNAGLICSGGFSILRSV